jgi:hypothetical protein
MKRTILLGLLALALPMAAFAGAVDFSNSGGTLTGNSSGLTLANSTVIQAAGLGTGAIGNDGTLNFATGSYIGTVGNVSTFNGGGSFTIVGNGNNGVPNGTIFMGSFSTPVTLTAEMPVDGTFVYTVKGQISGTWFTGQGAVGLTNQTWVGSFTAGREGFSGSATLGSGETIITTVPEPGTLGLLGTGMVGLAGVIRRKLKS